MSMTGEKKSEEGMNIFEVLLRLVSAVTATIGAVRAGQGAVKAWQRVAAAARGEEDPK